MKVFNQASRSGDSDDVSRMLIWTSQLRARMVSSLSSDRVSMCVHENAFESEHASGGKKNMEHIFEDDNVISLPSTVIQEVWKSYSYNLLTVTHDYYVRHYLM